MTTATLERASDVAFRVLFSLIFVIAGVGHFIERDVMLARLDEVPQQIRLYATRRS